MPLDWTMKPTKAAIATRPCLISAWRGKAGAGGGEGGAGLGGGEECEGWSAPEELPLHTRYTGRPKKPL